jgi:tRNA 2-thiouridine synthesizing protein C
MSDGGYRHGRKVMKKRLLYVNRRAPHGTVYGLEALEVVLVGAAFDQRVSVLFLDDGVFQLVRNQAPEGLAMKNYAKGFRALEDYGVEGVYVSAPCLSERALNEADLLLPVESLSSPAIAMLMDDHDVVFSF